MTQARMTRNTTHDLNINLFFKEIMHFIGIGGIGMSGIAEVLHTLGYTVQGSDLKDSPNTKRLKNLGIPVFIGHDPAHVATAGVVVVSTDIRPDNPELLAARAQKVPVVHRAEMLAELMRLKSAVAVGGTHGKTTTTSLVACLLDAAGIDPTVINGGIINAYGTNARRGAGPWIVVESDESDGSFVKLPATVAIVTNIDPEHMNHYGSIEALHQAFYQFVRNVPFYGLGIVCIDHPVVRELATNIQDHRILTYGFATDADIHAENVRQIPDGQLFDVVFEASAWPKQVGYEPIKILKDVFLPMFGRHNVQNSLAAITLAQQLGIDPLTIRQGFTNFQGVKRRFTKTGVVNDVTVVDDYGHHPVEIRAVLQTARSVCQGKVIAVIQPHRYTRVQDLFEEFSRCVEGADHVILAPIYSAGEAPIDGITHEALAQAIQARGAVSLEILQDPSDLPGMISRLVTPGDYVVCLGAGSITEWAQKLPEQLETLFHKQVS